MAATNTPIQSIVAATSVNSPASVTPTFAATQIGSFLILFVVATGTSPTITTPASWTLLVSTSSTTIAYACFIRPNNPGGITSVAVTVSATNGGAVAGGIEIATAGNPTEDVPSFNTFNFTGSTFSSFTNPIVTALGELAFFIVGCIGGNAITLTSNPGSYVLNASASASSTVATTNAQLAVYQNLSMSTSDQVPAGSIAGGSQPVVNSALRFLTSASTPISRGVGGAIAVGQSLNPAGSLQVPQPIAPGNFFSGTTGSF